MSADAETAKHFDHFNMDTGSVQRAVVVELLRKHDQLGGFVATYDSSTQEWESTAWIPQNGFFDEYAVIAWE